MAESAHQDELIAPEVNAWFYRETSLDELVVGAKPLDSMDDLVLDDLTPEEAQSFLRAIEE